jgi:hypothetical protein
MISSTVSPVQSIRIRISNLMARDLKELIREAAELAEDDRATLADVMIESLDPKPTPEVKAVVT